MPYDVDQWPCLPNTNHSGCIYLHIAWLNCEGTIGHPIDGPCDHQGQHLVRIEIYSIEKGSSIVAAVWKCREHRRFYVKLIALWYLWHKSTAIVIMNLGIRFVLQPHQFQSEIRRQENKMFTVSPQDVSQLDQ